MTTEPNLAELREEHASLNEQIAQEAALPQSDDLKISELKRRKLSLKDEISRLEHGQEVA